MKVKLKEKAADTRKPVAMIRDGKLYVGLDIHGSKQRNGALGEGGIVSSNGEGDIPTIHGHSFGSIPIYKGDTVEVTF